MSKTHKITQLKKRIATMERNLRLYRSILVENTDLYSEAARDPNASACGSKYYHGRADGAIQSRAELENLFNYWD